MEKLKMASSSLTERLKTSSAQMTQILSSKMKEILQSPTPESKMVDEATLETMEEPNWGLNLRICAMINSEEFNGTEIVKAIKKKVLSKSVVSQRLSLDLLEACTSNCDKVFSEVASEKVLEDMVRMIQDPRTDHGNREKGLQLIRGWGESEDLAYLPVFRQTHLSLKTSPIPAGTQDGTEPYTLGSFVNIQPTAPSGSYPMPETEVGGGDHVNFQYSYGGESVEEKKQVLLVTRNNVELLSSILDSGMEPIPIKDELTVSILDKCKQSLPVVQMIAETTTNDDIMLFEALNLHDELQQIISKCEEIEGTLVSNGEVAEHSDTTKGDTGNITETTTASTSSPERTEPSSEKTIHPPVESTESVGDLEKHSSLKEESAGTNINKRSEFRE